MKTTDILLIIINFAGALAVFLFAMTQMSAGLQKVAGSQMRAILARFTGNPLGGILTGMGVTMAIQSSSATTVMVVSFVSSGLLTLAGAVPVIMGANIGTTATAWLLTLLGMGGGDSAFSLPLTLAAVSLPMLLSRREKPRNVGQTIIGLALLLVGMDLLKGAMPNLEEYPALLRAIASLSGHGFGSVLIFTAIGALMTCIVQASAATMAITLLMCQNGWIGFEMAVALVMGENIGTTITANLAATVTNDAGKKAARAHLMFNVVGVVLTLLAFRPLTGLVAHVAEGMTGSSPYVAAGSIPVAISLFHTMFNVANTLIQVWFIRQIVWAVDRMVQSGRGSLGARLKDALRSAGEGCSRGLLWLYGMHHYMGSNGGNCGPI